MVLRGPGRELANAGGTLVLDVAGESILVARTKAAELCSAWTAEGSRHDATYSATLASSRLKYLRALSKQILRTIVPSSSASFGSSPFSTSRPIKLHSTRRKYSCRGKDMKDRESVSMPMKRESKPPFESAFSCHSMASFWSRNHQPLPN